MSQSIVLTCKSEDCSVELTRKRGSGRPPSWCDEHRKEQRRRQADSAANVCSEDDCDRFVRARGVCNMHWRRIARAEGRIAEQPWNDRRRNNHYIRKSRIADSGEDVRLADVVARDGNRCALCADPIDDALAWPHPFSRSLDHIVPLSRGGSHTLGNCQLAHLRCNISKGARVA